MRILDGRPYSILAYIELALRHKLRKAYAIPYLYLSAKIYHFEFQEESKKKLEMSSNAPLEFSEPVYATSEPDKISIPWYHSNIDKYLVPEVSRNLNRLITVLQSIAKGFLDRPGSFLRLTVGYHPRSYPTMCTR